MMKNPLNLLQIKEDDNLLKVALKATAEGAIVGASVGGFIGVLAIIGTAMKYKENNSVVDEIQHIIEEAK